MNLPFQPVVLWTDGLLFLLVAVVLGFVRWSRHEEHLRAPWRKVARSRRGGMVAVTVLAALCGSRAPRLAPLSPGALPTDKPGAEVTYAPEVLSVLDTFAASVAGRIGTHLLGAVCRNCLREGNDHSGRRHPACGTSRGSGTAVDCWRTPDVERVPDIARRALRAVWPRVSCCG